MKQHELFDLEALEVSLVPKGANKKIFIIYKSEEGDSDMDKELINKLTGYNLPETTLQKIEKGTLSETGKSATKAAVRLLSAFKNDLPKDFLSQLSDLSGLNFQK